MVEQVCSLTKNGGVFFLLHTVQCVLSLEFFFFYLSHSGVCMQASHSYFDFISQMTKDFEHFFKSFLVISDSCVETSLFSSVPDFLIGLFELLVYNLLSYLKFWILAPCQM